MDWHTQVEAVTPHVFHISTPNGRGTGFLVRNREGTFTVATAAHVLRDAKVWEQRIELRHPAFRTALLLSSDEYRIGLHASLDSAFLVASIPRLQDDAYIPEVPIAIVPPGETVKPGVEVGWLGYPHLVGQGSALCFFAGHVSHVEPGDRYFIDGTSIHGVSGGPAFYYSRGEDEPGVRILGSVAAYVPNRATGEALPGLMVAENVAWAHEVAATAGAG